MGLVLMQVERRNKLVLGLPVAVLLFAGAGVYFMPVVLGIVRRALGTMAEKYVPGAASMAFVTVPNMEVGRTLAHGLVKEKLVACVNIIPSLTSVYEWEGKVEEDGELLLMIKTQTSKVDAVSAY